MNYEELIAKAVQGRPVVAVAKEWGINNMTLSRYLRGERMPDFDTALKIANAAGVEDGEAFRILARAHQIYKSRQFKLQSGFVQTQLVALLAVAAVATSLYIMSNRRRSLGRSLAHYLSLSKSPRLALPQIE